MAEKPQLKPDKHLLTQVSSRHDLIEFSRWMDLLRTGHWNELRGHPTPRLMSELDTQVYDILRKGPTHE